MEKIGQYATLKKLGSGGFGEVWLGKSDLRQVAIKVFKPEADNLSSFVEESVSDASALEGLRQRFSQEAKILADLDTNPHVVSVYEFGELEDGSPYYVMPFLPLSLADKLGKDIYDANALAELSESDRPKNIALNDAIRYIEQLLIGLSAAHERGLIHRDIKPSNVMLTQAGEIQLVDFGIAKTPDSQHSVSQVGMGSAKYMAPEQRESAKHVDARADVYSVGVLAYRMITGRLPGMPFRDPNVFASELGQEMNDVIVACLSDDKSQRASDALLLLEQFRACDQVASDKNATGTWVGDAGEAQLRDEFLPLKQEIERILDIDFEVSESARAGLLMMASVVDLDENGLDDLIEQIETNLGLPLKLKRNFMTVVETTIRRTGRLSDIDRQSLIKSAAPLNLPEPEIKKLIALMEQRIQHHEKVFDDLLVKTLGQHERLSDADRAMLYRAGETLHLTEAELIQRVDQAETKARKDKEKAQTEQAKQNQKKQSQSKKDKSKKEQATQAEATDNASKSKLGQKSTSNKTNQQNEKTKADAKASQAKLDDLQRTTRLFQRMCVMLRENHFLSPEEQEELIRICDADGLTEEDYRRVYDEAVESLGPQWLSQWEFLDVAWTTIMDTGKPDGSMRKAYRKRGLELGLTKDQIDRWVIGAGNVFAFKKAIASAVDRSSQLSNGQKTKFYNKGQPLGFTKSQVDELIQKAESNQPATSLITYLFYALLWIGVGGVLYCNYSEQINPPTTVKSSQGSVDAVLKAEMKKLTMSVQSELLRLGYPVGKADGISGPKTRSAIIEYQKTNRLLIDGRATKDLLTHLRRS